MQELDSKAIAIHIYTDLHIYWLSVWYHTVNRKQYLYMIRNTYAFGNMSLCNCVNTCRALVDSLNINIPCDFFCSIYIRECTSCVLVVAGEQFRARDCRKCNVFLYSATQPVIESSSGMKFGCFQCNYPQLTCKVYIATVLCMYSMISMWRALWTKIHVSKDQWLTVYCHCAMRYRG